MPTQFTIQPSNTQTHRLNYAYVAAGTTGGSRTMVVGDMFNSIYVRSALGGSATDTSPTASALIGAIEAPVVGSSFEFIVLNQDGSSQVLTIAGGSGVTTVGTMTVAALKAKRIVGVVTALGPINTQAVVLISTDADSTN